jgi:hypothetical protein
MSKTTIRLVGRLARANAIDILSRLAEGWTVTFAPPKRSSAQNDKLHVLLSEIASKAEWAGKKWDIEDWKRLLTAAWMRTRKQAAVMVPAVDGHGFEVLYRRTSKLTKEECADLITFIEAWAAEQGIATEECHA